jgi:N-acyl-D-amino-acid deacylase
MTSCRIPQFENIIIEKEIHMQDLLITNAGIIDGTGSPLFKANLAVTGGVITHMAPDLEMPCRKTIDAPGLVACPGFIDMHTHSDFTLLLEPHAESRIRQGITTEVTGNCGGSPGPVTPSGQKAFMEYMTDLGRLYKRCLAPEHWNWETLDEFYDHLSARGTAVNMVPLVGHSTLRANVMGYRNEPPDPQELHQMIRLLEKELENGIFGLSSGLIYHPGAFARTEELAALASVVKAYNGIYATHMRSEGRYLFDAVEEALSVARKSGVSLEISHLKCETPAMWGQSARLLEVIDQARQMGVQVDFDQYPYTAYGTSLLELFPVWAKETGSSRMMALLSDPMAKNKIIADMTHRSGTWEYPLQGLDWDRIQIMGYTRPENKGYNGLSVADLSAALGLDPLEAVFQVFCQEKGGLGMIVFAMSETDLITILKDPTGMVGSDGCAASPAGPAGQSLVHPRFYGTFPRILGTYVREKQVISLEQAVHKMTGLPAKKLGLKHRGRIEKGMAADLVLFDPDTVADMASFTDSHRFPAGIVHVVVNGRPVLLNGESTGALPGKRLSREG